MKIRVSEIVVGKRLRPRIGQEAVERIAAASKKDGQKRPILVRTDGKRPRLVAGARRLAAAKLLGWTHIEAEALKLDGMSRERADIEAQLAEIDDNFPDSILRKGMTLKKRQGKTSGG
jgi:ParB-like chromosome segregation protein Spo0J